MKNFVSNFVQFKQGDNAQQLAEKTLRQADSALTSQISSLEGDTVQKEDALTDAQEALQLAVINHGKPITDRHQYIENLLSAQNTVTRAEESLDAHKAKIEFLTKIKESINAETVTA